MDDRRLEDLLREADALIPPPPSATDLVGRVRRRRRQRVLVHGSLAGAALLVLSAAALIRLGPQPKQTIVEVMPPRHVTPQRTQDPARLRAEYQQLVAEAELHERSAERLMRRDIARRPRAAIAPDAVRADALADIRGERNRAARALVDLGDTLSNEPGERAAAAHIYRQAAELFPETRDGAAAKARLSRT